MIQCWLHCSIRWLCIFETCIRFQSGSRCMDAIIHAASPITHFCIRAGDYPTLDSYHTHSLIITLWRLEMHLKYTISVQLRLSWSEVETWKYHRTKFHDPCVAFNWNVSSWVLATKSLGGFFEWTTLDDCVSIDIAKKQDYILGGYIQEKKAREQHRWVGIGPLNAVSLTLASLI